MADWRFLRPSAKAVTSNCPSKGSTPKCASNFWASGALCEDAHTTAPKRRGSCKRKTPRSVTKSMWSCGPGASWRGAKFKLPDMPKCSSKSPSSRSNNRYLPLRRTPSTVRPTKLCGDTPKGQRKGLPMCMAKIRAWAMRSAKLRRVTSTSGSSGIRRSDTSGRHSPSDAWVKEVAGL